jgi:acyl carrier protein
VGEAHELAGAGAPGATPTTRDVLERIRSELAVLDPDVPPERVTSDATVASLDMESVTLLSLVAELEDAYSIRLTELELAGIATVRDLVALVQRHAGRRAAKDG